MADGSEYSQTPQVQINNELNAEGKEPLQVLTPSLAPGASCLTSQGQSRLGLFKVIAGLSPATVSTMALSQPSNQAAEIPSCISHPTYATSACDVGPTVTLSGDSTRVPLPSDVTPGFSCSPGMHMSPPASNINTSNYMMSMLFSQYKETAELCKQQQTALNKLNETVNGLIKGQSTCGTETVYESECESLCQYDPVTSDSEGVVSDDEVRQQAASVKRKSTDCVSADKLKKLKAVESQFTPQELFGPSVHEAIAATVNKGLSEPVDHKSSSVQDLLSKYNRAENCSFLDVPKVNKLLWSNRQTNKDLKQEDKSVQRTQTYMTKGMVPLIQIMNKTLSMNTPDAEDLFELSLDAFNLLAYAHRDLSSHRRRLLLPAISSRYAVICNDSEKFSSATQLFGDDKELEKRLKEIDENQKLGKSLSVQTSKSKFQPSSASGSNWTPRERAARPTGTSNRAFLGKRALTQHRKPQQHYRGGVRKDQGPKKGQATHRR